MDIPYISYKLHRKSITIATSIFVVIMAVMEHGYNLRNLPSETTQTSSTLHQFEQPDSPLVVKAGELPSGVCEVERAVTTRKKVTYM